MIAVETITYTQALKLIDHFPVSIQAELTAILDHLNDAYARINSAPDMVELMDQLPADIQAEYKKVSDHFNAAHEQTDSALEIGVIRGDVNVDMFELPGSFDIVFIIGNTSVKTFICDAGPSDFSLLAISGNVAADAVISLCSMVVGGTIQTRCIYANSLNDGQLLVGENILAAQLFLESGQFTQCMGSLQAPLIISTHNEVRANQGMQGNYYGEGSELYLKFFLDTMITTCPEMAWDGNGWRATGAIERYINSDALLAALKNGENILNASGHKKSIS
jgi:hypothetical protein